MCFRPVYIFDLDGTISLNHHRAHFVEGENKDWKSFFESCDKDQPNYPVIDTLRLLRKVGEIWIWSGRSEDVREKTLDWLMNNRVIDNRNYRSWYRNPNRFLMRKSGDYTPDHILKKQWLDNLHCSERRRLCAVFDDRKTVVDMWRDNGVACFQVADGNF